MNRQTRSVPCDFQTRAEGDDYFIEGYFAVFDSVYNIAPGMSESIASGAFSSSMGGDVRALINHDTTLVMGRTTAGTLELREDERGLWGRIAVNPNDRAAVDAFERVKRGDVTQCSIGFDILSEDTDVRDDGSVHWTIRDVHLWEVSVCTFPAYEETAISARADQVEEIKKREAQAWREKTMARLRGEKDGIEGNHAPQED